MAKTTDISVARSADGRLLQGNQLHTIAEGGGRPSKAGGFIRAIACVLDGPDPRFPDEDHPAGFAVIYTDRELFEMANELLEDWGEPEKCIHISTFDNYKAGKIKDHEELAEFRRLYARALRRQKASLFARMLDEGEKRSWQRYLALIERKFDEWNLRTKTVDESPRPKQLVMRVLGAGEDVPAGQGTQPRQVSDGSGEGDSDES